MTNFVVFFTSFIFVIFLTFLFYFRFLFYIYFLWFNLVLVTSDTPKSHVIFQGCGMALAGTLMHKHGHSMWKRRKELIILYWVKKVNVVIKRTTSQSQYQLKLLEKAEFLLPFTFSSVVACTVVWMFASHCHPSKTQNV